MTDNLRAVLDRLANEKFPVSNDKINQKVRNGLKSDFSIALAEFLDIEIGSKLVSVAVTQKGVGISIDNDKVGMIPIEIVPTFKDLNTDIADLNAEYEEHKAEMEAKRIEAEKKKAEKIAQDKLIREKKAELKALKESAVDTTDSDFNDIE